MGNTQDNSQKEPRIVDRSTEILEILMRNASCPFCGNGITPDVSSERCYWCGGPVIWEKIQEDKVNG